MSRSRRLALGVVFAGLLAGLLSGVAAEPQPLKVTLRSQVRPFQGSAEVAEVQFDAALDPAKTALVLCDVWDRHWCQKASQRCDALAPKMNRVAEAARKRGVFVVHAPSECMEFYANSPARLRMKNAAKVNMPKPLELPDPPCPVDSSDGGCDDEAPVKPFKAWSRQHAAVRIDDELDGITDQGAELYSALKARGIDTLLVMGVHTNMCILHRSFAIKPMSRLGVRCILVRDMTDAMYNPRMAPMVSHEEGTERVIRFIEQNWCPSMLSRDLLGRQ